MTPRNERTLEEAGIVLSVPDSDVATHELSREEGEEIFDEAARRYLKMSGEEFLRKWEAKEFGDDPDQPGVMDVAMLLSLVRQERS